MSYTTLTAKRQGREREEKENIAAEEKLMRAFTKERNYKRKKRKKKARQGLGGVQNVSRTAGTKVAPASPLPAGSSPKLLVGPSFQKGSRLRFGFYCINNGFAEGRGPNGRVETGPLRSNTAQRRHGKKNQRATTIAKTTTTTQQQRRRRYQRQRQRPGRNQAHVSLGLPAPSPIPPAASDWAANLPVSLLHLAQSPVGLSQSRTKGESENEPCARERG